MELFTSSSVIWSNVFTNGSPLCLHEDARECTCMCESMPAKPYMFLLLVSHCSSYQHSVVVKKHIVSKKKAVRKTTASKQMVVNNAQRKRFFKRFIYGRKCLLNLMDTPNAFW